MNNQNPVGRVSPKGVIVTEGGTRRIAEEIRLPVLHTYLPSKSRVAQLILERIATQYDSASSTAPY